MNAQQRTAETNRQTVLDSLRQVGIAELTDVVAATGLTHPTCRKHLEELVTTGRVAKKRVEKQQGGRRQYCYRLVGE